MKQDNEHGLTTNIRGHDSNETSHQLFFTIQIDFTFLRSLDSLLFQKRKTSSTPFVFSSRSCIPTIIISKHYGPSSIIKRN